MDKKVISNAPESEKMVIKRELEVKIHDLVFSSIEDKVLEKL